MTAPANFEDFQVNLAQLPGYERREHQIALARVYEEILTAGDLSQEDGPDGSRVSGHGLLEAGTGTGKSLALLAPAIIWAVRERKRVVVATATKALQGQYAGKDLPFLQESLDLDFTWAILKGRSNYPCLAKAAEVKFPSAAQQDVLDRVEALGTPEALRDLEVTDREDFPALRDEEWRHLSMAAGECPGAKSCKFGEKCIAERAKAKAAGAQVVVTNTAYLMLDLLLRGKSEGNVTLLGEVDRVVIDEAHTLPDAATSALEDTLSEPAFLRAGRDMAAYLDSEGLDEQPALDVEPAVTALWKAVSAQYRAFAARERGNDPMPLPQKALIGEALGPLFIGVAQAVRAAREEILGHRVYDEDVKLVRSRLLNRSAKLLEQVMDYTLDSDDVTIRWAELKVTQLRGEKSERVVLRSAPVSVAPVLRRVLWDAVPTTLVSATLTSGGDFSYIAETVGLNTGEGTRYSAGSPFNFPEQAVLFTPDKDKPAPAGDTKAAWGAYAQGATRWLVEQSQGGALLLFTSRKAMDEAYAALAGGFRARGLHVMKQGDAPNGELVRVMKEDGSAVLFALRTFFEGIDIQGSALRLVVIDKLPFSVPTDLVHKARADAIVRKYGRWADFNKMTVPEMVLVLTQAFGRLIRHADDRGVVAILDPRLKSKGYGREILRALPPARQTTDPRVAGDFLVKSR
jgi:ATP-dependent DNA helicase DinG